MDLILGQSSLSLALARLGWAFPHSSKGESQGIREGKPSYLGSVSARGVNAVVGTSSECPIIAIIVKGTGRIGFVSFELTNISPIYCGSKAKHC